MKRVKSVILLLFFLVFVVAAEAADYCQIGRDPLNPSRTVNPGEMVQMLDRDMPVEMAGGRRTYKCTLKEGTNVVTSATPNSYTRRVVWVKDCGNLIINDVYLPALPAQISAEDLFGRSGLGGVKAVKATEKKKECIGWSVGGFTISAAVVAYGVGNHDKAITIAGGLGLLAFLVAPKDSSWECNLAGALIGAGGGYYFGDKNRRTDEDVRQQQQPQQPVVPPPEPIPPL